MTCAGNIILKLDGEPAVLAVRDAVAKYHGGIVVQERPAVGESPSNGLVEEAGKTVKGVCAGTEIADRGKDEREAEVRRRDHPVDDKMGSDDGTWSVKMGERAEKSEHAEHQWPLSGRKVWYKQIREQKERKDKIESEWHEGLWPGQSRSTNETIMETAKGVVRAYATRRQDADERWKGDFIKKFQGTPARPDPNRGQLMTPIRVWFDPQVAEPDPTKEPWKEPQMRRMKITESMLQKYGHTEGCEGCRANAAGMT